MIVQGEPVDVIYLDFSKSFDSMCHLLLVKEMVAMGIHLKITHWVEVFLKNRTYRVKLGGHLFIEGIVKKRCASGLGAWATSVPDIYIDLNIDLNDHK